MFDFSKAFDYLGHDRILNKLDNLVIRNAGIDWFMTNLELHSQLVEVKHTEKRLTYIVRSKALTITRSVPWPKINILRQ